MVKDFAKNIIGSHCSTFDYPILINSYGRSGSTVLTKSIINNAIIAQNEKIQNIAFRSISQSAWNLENAELKNGIVYKTHDYPPEKSFKKEVRMLYTFANPVDVVLSLLRLYDERGEEWMKEHYEHLKAPYTTFKNIINEDQLKLENHLDTWLNEDRFPVAFIKYEAMWEHQNDISEFLGFHVELPPFRKREAKKETNSEIMYHLKNTYNSLRNKLNSLDNFFVKNGKC